MKRTILAPLLSALVLPGLGQVINGQVRKAGLLIAAVSLLFLALFLKVLYDLNKVFFNRPWDTAMSDPLTLPQVARTLSGQDKTVLFILLFLLFGIWIYGIWDAYRGARRSESPRADATVSH
jgi:TM2 domain-containing membrane protein YozV